MGKAIEKIGLPAGAQLISRVREGKAELVDAGTTLNAGDQVIAILEPGREDEVRKVLLGR